MNSTIAPNKRKARIRGVGIALAAYKPDPRTFAEQLKSIVEQDFSRWHCVVTCDSSLSDLRKEPHLAAFFSDPRFHFSENAVRLGHKANFDLAITRVAELPEVDAIACCDQDDVWVSGKLTTLVEALNDKPLGSLVHSDMRLLFSPPGGPEELGGTLWSAERRQVDNSHANHLIIRSIVNGAAMMFDVHLVHVSRGIPAGVQFHDQWYAALAAAVGGVYPVRDCLVHYRQHGGNVVGASRFSGRFSLPSAGRVRGWKALSFHFLSRWQETEVLSACLESRVRGLRGPGLVDLFWYAVRFMPSDPVLARAAFGRLIGFFLAKIGRLSRG